ncbi:MAG: glycosyltransferase, partial [Candidatus Binatia bacterium]
PLAVLEQRTAGTVRESVYVCEALLTQVPLPVYWRERKQHWSRQQRCAFLRALAEFLRTFHAAGLYSGDLKDENLLVGEEGAAHWKFYLVDLDRVTRYPRLSRRRRLKNLVQLERTLGRRVRVSERLFFLYQYLGTPLPPRAERRVLALNLLRLRARKDREYARRRARRARRSIGLAPLQLYSANVSAPRSPQGMALDRAPISCCIVCFNEETHIRRCLESIKWCDEIIVVDSFSTDQTVAICQEYTCHVIQRAWPGYVKQKRFALAQATHEWVLNVDADEEVSPELQNEILTVLQRDDPAVDGFAMPRLVYYLGQWWWRGWYPGYVLRLFRKARVRWGGVDPHEKVLLRGQADQLRGNLYHYTYTDISDHLRSLNSLTETAAHERSLLGRRVGLTDLCLRPLWRFLRMYFLRGCFREGAPGFFVAVTAAFYVFLKYAKLWELSVGDEDSARRSGTQLGRGRSPGAGADSVSQLRRSSLRGGL